MQEVSRKYRSLPTRREGYELMKFRGKASFSQTEELMLMRKRNAREVTVFNRYFSP